MRRTLITAQVDIATGPMFELELPDPGRWVHVRTLYKPKQLTITMAQPPLVPILQLVFEIDPDGKPRRRRFVVLPEQVTITGEGELRFLGVASDPKNVDRVIAVYEEPIVDPIPENLEEWCDIERDRHVWVHGHEWCRCGSEHVRDRAAGP